MRRGDGGLGTHLHSVSSNGREKMWQQKSAVIASKILVSFSPKRQ